MSVKKSTCERYDVRASDKPGGDWAVIMLDERGGMLSIQSSYGNYGYSWSSPGMRFKEFLIKLNADYLMSKLGRSDYFDGEKTMAACRKAILEQRRNDEIKVRLMLDRRFDGLSRSELKKEVRVVAREAWEAVDGFYGCTSLYEAYQVYNDRHDDLLFIFEDAADVPTCTDFHPDLKSLVEILWPVFIEYLKTEAAKGCGE